MLKRFTGIILAVVMVMVMAVPGIADRGPVAGFSVSGVKSFTVSGAGIGGKMISSQTSDDTAAIYALTDMLNKANALSVQPSGVEETAKLTLDLDNGGKQDFSILAQSGRLYAKTGSKIMEIDADAFHIVMNVFGNELYKYRAVPSISAKLGTTILNDVYVENTSYAYRKLDNKYYKPYFASGINSPQTISPNGKWGSLEFSLKPDYYSVSIYTNGKTAPVFTSTSFEAAGDYVAKRGDEVHTVKVRATFKDSRNDMFKGEITYTFIAGKAVKDTDFTLEGGSTYPGEVVVMRISNYKAGDEITFKSGINFNPVFFDDGDGGKIALLPVSYYTGVGEQTITLTCGSKYASWSVSVKDKAFQIQNLEVDSTTTSSTINSTAANNEYEKFIAPLRFVGDAEKHWDSFVWPVTGPRSTEFGMIRYVNGAPTSTRHGAIDFAVPRGTTVKATASGRVLYAGNLQLTGNTVLIEHGYGLKSWYYHMDSLNVKTGDMVTMSQKIGEVGSTGFSTGAHLHFGMSVNNVFINPDTVIDTDLLKD